MSDPIYPEIEVQLVGQDGNAFLIIGRVREALRSANVGSDEIQKFTDEATAGDYNHVLQTVMRWVEVT